MELIQMSNITKRFGTTIALNGVDFTLKKGEILSMLGENGAGKTTLMKVLYGMISPDAGEICYRGEKICVKKPLDAIQRGICMVHQHFMLVPAFSVTENIITGQEPKKGIFVDTAKARDEVRALIDRFQFQLDPDTLVEKLSVGEQQRVEILKALYRKADVLILDEPTAVLTPHEVEALIVILKRLRDEGTSIVIITHKLRETMSLADRICVLRDGVMIHNNVLPAETTMEKLSEMMVGRKVELHVHNRAQSVGDTALEAKSLTASEGTRIFLRDISFQVRYGEILGIAGIEGNGQTQLLECLTGLRQPDSPCLQLCGKPLAGTPDTFLRSGIAHVPEDRQSMGLVCEMGLRENAVLGYHREPAVCSRGLLKDGYMSKFAQTCKETFLIKIPTPDTPVRMLSGGNQQKVIIARAFSHDPNVLIVAHPTRGVDVGAMEYIHKQLFALRDKGKAILLVSADLDEVRSLSDRILVLYEGEIVAQAMPDEYSEVQLGLLMTGSTLPLEKEEQA